MLKNFFSTINVGVTPFEVIRGLWIIISTTISAVFFFLWGRKKIILNRFLHGTWAGYLIDQNDHDFIIHCMLFISYHPNFCKGSMIYESKKNGSTYAHGVDRLLSYDCKDIFPNTWNPIFERIFHRYNDTNSLVENQSTYQYNCNIRKKLSKDIMDVTLSFNNRNMKGVWYRN